MMRDNKLDFYKGILIIGVVYGHILNLIKEGTTLSFGLHTLIRTFDMPCFMLIAGYLLSKSVEKYKCIPYIANKTTNLALPLVFFGGYTMS